MSFGTLALDAETLYQQLRHTLRSVIGAQTRLVGIASGGVWMAQRLHTDLKLEGQCGVISSSLHRDDFRQRGLANSVQTHLPFSVNAAHIILLDDVIFTGRTVRATLNELFDYGRPTQVQLAVLVDRGGRQLPIEANWAAARTTIAPDQTLALCQDATGRFMFSLESQA